MTNQGAVLIVGAGVIGAQHAEVVGRCEGLSLAGVVDVLPQRAKELAATYAQRFDAPEPRVFAELTEALAWGGFDRVSICTPSGIHVEQSIAALEAGFHTLLEKPLDVSVARGRELAAAATQAAERGLVCSVISQHRFDASSVAVARAAHTGRFGRVVSAVASVSWWRSQGYYDSGDWRGTWALDGGGALMNQGVHTADLLLWFLGRPVQVFAHTALLAHERVEVEDTAVATVTFESGALAVLHATTAAYPGLTVRIQVHGSAGSAVIDNDRLRYFHAFDPSQAVDDRGEAGAANQAAAEVGEAAASDGTGQGMDLVTAHLEQYRDVDAAIRTGSTPRVTVDDALLALAFVQSVYISQALGQPVLVADVLDGQYDEVDLASGLRP